MKLRDVLVDLGFVEIRNAWTDQQPSYVFDFGNLKLTAAQVTNEYLRPVFLFVGMTQDRNSIEQIIFEMPIEVESFEQGVAWVVDRLGNRFHPIKSPPWLEQGLAWQDCLPWVRDSKAFAARPRCIVDREWWRVAVKKIREQVSLAADFDLVSFSFDGETLRVKTNGTLIVVPAEGQAWDRSFSLLLKSLDSLPKRLMHSRVLVDAWKREMRLDNRRFALAAVRSSENYNSPEAFDAEMEDALSRG